MTWQTNDIPGCEYRLERWLRWPEEVHSFVEDFYARFGMFPDALVASPSTFARMDIAASPEHIKDAMGEQPSDAEYATLGGMCAPEYQLTFLLNDAVVDRGVLLVREAAGPDGEGEPVYQHDHDKLRAVG